MADQFLSCASLQEFELEDCMETEEMRREGGEREEERVSECRWELETAAMELGALKASLSSLVVRWSALRLPPYINIHKLNAQMHSWERLNSSSHFPFFCGFFSNCRWAGSRRVCNLLHTSWFCFFFSFLWTIESSDVWEISPVTRIPVRYITAQRQTKLKRKDKRWMKHEISCWTEMEKESQMYGVTALSFQNRKYLLHNAEAVQRERVLRNGLCLTFLHTKLQLQDILFIHCT